MNEPELEPVLIEVPFVEQEPQDRGPEQPCWCPDSFLVNGLCVAYCPRHGREPDPELQA